MAGGSETRRGPMIVLLVLLCGVGGWNYYRNAQIDAAEQRPYRGYSDEQLQQLIGAYQDEVDAQMAVYRNATAGKPVTVRDGGLLDDRIDEFERVQGLSKQRRERAYKVTENQILVEQLAKERVARERDRPLYKMIFRRLTTF